MLHVTKRPVFITNNRLGIKGLSETVCMKPVQFQRKSCVFLPFMGAERETATNARTNGTASALYGRAKRNICNMEHVL